MTEPYRGRVEYATSGSTTVEIDDLDSTSWVGTPTGGFLISGNTPEVWEVGVILLEGTRAWQYATADLDVRRTDRGERSIRFHGKTAFTPMLSADDVRAAQQRWEARRAERARHRVPIRSESDPKAPAVADATLSILERPRRSTDELPPWRHTSQFMRSDTARLALDHEGFRIYIAEGTTPDSIADYHQSPDGGDGGSAFLRSVLSEHGAAIGWSTSSAHPGVVVHGVVPDQVTAVHVNDEPAVMGENAFLAWLPDVSLLDRITLTTLTDTHVTRYGPPPEL